MNAEQIWATICSLANSQGLYGRIKNAIIESGNKEGILAKLEKQNFKDSVDLVLFFES